MVFFSVEGIERETEATTEAKSNEERPWSRVRFVLFRWENLIIEQFTFLPTYYRVEYLIYFLILFLFFFRALTGKYPVNINFSRDSFRYDRDVLF